MNDYGKVQNNLTATTGLPSHATLVVAGFTTVAIQVSGTMSLTLLFEGTVDNHTWVAIEMATSAVSATVVNGATAAGMWLGRCGGLYAVRVRCSAYTSGAAITSIGAA